MKLIYVANIRLPTEKAYGVQIMKTCEAIARLGIDVRLIIPTRKSIAFAGVDPFEYYGVEKILRSNGFRRLIHGGSYGSRRDGTLKRRHY